jgi:beta-N-acetylhexosaminidase
MSELERLAGGVIVCGFDGLVAPEPLRDWLTDETVAGVILFKRNIADVTQAAALIEECNERSGSALPILVGVDQEGGRVARFGDPVIHLPPMRKLAALDDLDLTRESARVLARQLRAIGINLNFAPVLDVDTNPDNPVIGDRAFGSNPDAVIAHALAFAEGLHEGGVLSCGKHFPGHGDTDLDSHFALPRLSHGRNRLDEIELRPFRAAVGVLPSVMTAHVVFEALDPATPATMSHRVIAELLREEIGFAGAVFSDDLEMKAVSERYSLEEAGARAIDAGCDLLLVCSDVDGAARLRDELARRAGKSAAFRATLEAARARAEALRLRIAELPPPASIENALGSADARAIEARLRQI